LVTSKTSNYKGDEMKKDTETGNNLFTYNEVVEMNRKHYDNHKKRYPLGTPEYSLVMRFFEPLTDDFMRLYLGKPLVKFDDNGLKVRDND
jgi:hypothetical protein